MSQSKRRSGLVYLARTDGGPLSIQKDIGVLRRRLSVLLCLVVSCYWTITFHSNHATDPEQLWKILSKLPWHADTLLQMSEVYRHREGNVTL